jgi:hypothetical protein
MGMLDKERVIAVEFMDGDWETWDWDDRDMSEVTSDTVGMEVLNHMLDNNLSDKEVKQIIVN